MGIPKKYLTEKVILIESRIDDKSILRILTQNKQINKTDPNYSYYVQLANWANSNQEKTGKVDLSTIKLTDRSLIQNGKLANNTKHLGVTLEQLKNLMDQEGKYNPNSELSNTIQKTTLEILAWLKDPKPKEEQKLYAGMDWTAEKAKRLENSNGKATSEILDEFYNDYYKIEYAGLRLPDDEDTTGIVDKLKSLDKILIQEFNKLGYNPAVNPMAKFLKILIEHKDDLKIFDKLTVNNYGAIHNSFIDKYISGNTLGNYNDKHILFCEDLYNYKGLDMVKYLKLYKETLDTAESAKVEPPQKDKWKMVAKIFIRQNLPDVDSKSQFTDIVDKLLIQEDPQMPTANGAKLRTLSEIEELYTYIFKAAPSTEKHEENKTLKLIVDQAKTQNIILDMLAHISQRNDFKHGYPKATSTIARELTELNYEPNNNGIETSKQILARYEKQLEIGDLYTIVKELFTAYNTHKHNKKADK